MASDSPIIIRQDDVSKHLVMGRAIGGLHLAQVTLYHSLSIGQLDKSETYDLLSWLIDAGFNIFSTSPQSQITTGPEAITNGLIQSGHCLHGLV